MKKFYRAVFLSTFLWTITLAGLVYLSFFHPILKQNSSKFVKYRSSKGHKLPTTIFQVRNSVSKDLWITSKDTRVHCHLESPSSTLRFLTTNRKPALIESLTQLKIWIKEPNEVKYLRASTGDYNYSQRSLNTHDTFLSTYKMDNLNSNFFSGLAKEVSITFDNSPLSFTASGFSAHLQTGGSL